MPYDDYIFVYTYDVVYLQYVTRLLHTVHYSGVNTT